MDAATRHLQKNGAPGFVHVFVEQTILYAEDSRTRVCRGVLLASRYLEGTHRLEHNSLSFHMKSVTACVEIAGGPLHISAVGAFTTRPRGCKRWWTRFGCACRHRPSHQKLRDAEVYVSIGQSYIGRPYEYGQLNQYLVGFVEIQHASCAHQ